jgi:glucosamine--fructose-6-phosphate aminotransferase (isomerizing)
MNTTDEKYTRFALCREMMETMEVVRDFDSEGATAVGLVSDMILFSGEGSSRIFPAKQAISASLRRGRPQDIVTENASQSLEYQLAGRHVFVASNSGKTAEGVRLIRHLRERASAEPAAAAAAITGVVAHSGTPIATESDSAFVLGCGNEDAVAATKSVVEQALFYETLLRAANGEEPIDRETLASLIATALTAEIPGEVIGAVVGASVLYFAGRNDGVAEELTLKTNEITRKRSDFLEGTYAVHGIEEVMDSSETVILVEPFEWQEEKFSAVLEKGVGMQVVAISSRQTRFPTIRIPDGGDLAPWVQLASGWNLLVEVGLSAGIDLDKPVRARKVGNEFVG